MKTCWILALLCSGIPALAYSGGMEKAIVHAMRKAPCVDLQSGAHQYEPVPELAGNVPVGNGGSQCIEYQLRTGKVSYVIRPRRAILLLLGTEVYIRLVKDELLLHTSDAPKNIHCAVLAMSLLSEEDGTEAKKDGWPSHICLSRSGEEVPCSADPEPFP